MAPWRLSSRGIRIGGELPPWRARRRADPDCLPAPPQLNGVVSRVAWPRDTDGGSDADVPGDAGDSDEAGVAWILGGIRCEGSLMSLARAH